MPIVGVDLRRVNMIRPAQIKEKDKYSQAIVNVPVNCFRRPVRYGPTNPPTLPHEFIKPIAPAAAGPVRNVVGYDHQTPNAE